MFATKVQILDVCQECRGQAYLPVEEAKDWKGLTYIRHTPCNACGGSGKKTRWVDLPELWLLLEQSKCTHEHVVRTGDFHLTGGEVWDDIRDVCSDCGQIV